MYLVSPHPTVTFLVHFTIFSHLDSCNSFLNELLAFSLASLQCEYPEQSFSNQVWLWFIWTFFFHGISLSSLCIPKEAEPETQQCTPWNHQGDLWPSQVLRFFSSWQLRTLLAWTPQDWGLEERSFLQKHYQRNLPLTPSWLAMPIVLLGILVQMFTKLRIPQYRVIVGRPPYDHGSL